VRCKSGRGKVFLAMSGRFRVGHSETKFMQSWFSYAVLAAILYGLHQIFTKMASEQISDGLGGFVVERRQR